MKNLRTFDQFVNESNINEAKYDNTWYRDIVFAKEADKRDKKDGGSGYENQRALVRNIEPDKYNIDWENAADKEISKYLNDTKKRIQDEVANKRLSTELDTHLKRLNLRIRAHAGVPKSMEIRFVKPCLMNGEYTNKRYKEIFAFLGDTKALFVEASPTVVNKFEVEYSGTIRNDNGDEISYAGVNNGLAVVPG